MNKKTVLLAFAFAAVFAAGMVVMRVWTAQAPAEDARSVSLAQLPPSQSLLTVDLEDASAAEGVVEVEEPKYADDSSIPSQLSKIKVEGMADILPLSDGSGAAETQPDQNVSVTLPEGAKNLVPSTASAEPAPLPEDSKISMINAPVKARLINTLAEYKQFKQEARGKYPQADFNKEMVVVLESDSNLPDKVFEIQDVQAKDGKLTVIYRVNIFDLDQKVNTHSAKTVKKSSLPLELMQVL